MDKNFDQNLLIKEKSESSELESKCRQAISSIMYAVLGTRPDLFAAVNLLSRYQNCASKELWRCIQHVMHYIKQTIDLKLVTRKGRFRN
jgi:hypothetical protein